MMERSSVHCELFHLAIATGQTGYHEPSAKREWASPTVIEVD
jgi:hypothetical protein